MEDYYTKFKALVDELPSYQTIPLYKCPCTYESQRIASDLNDYDQVMRFLMGLNDSYSAIRGPVLLYEPLVDINKVLSLILQEEKQRSFKNGDFSRTVITHPIEATTFYSDARSGPKHNGKGNSKRKDQFALIVGSQDILLRSVSGCMVFHLDLSSEINLWQIKSLTIRCQVLGMPIMLKPVKIQVFHFHNSQSPIHSVSNFWLS